MPRYTVLVTRDVTESVAIEVIAENAAAAREVALEHVFTSDDPPAWELDDPPCQAEPYVTDVTRNS